MFVISKTGGQLYFAFPCSKSSLPNHEVEMVFQVRFLNLSDDNINFYFLFWDFMWANLPKPICNKFSQSFWKLDRFIIVNIFSLINVNKWKRVWKFTQKNINEIDKWVINILTDIINYLVCLLLSVLN